MIDIESEDRRLIEETINRFPAFSYGTGLEIILTEFAKQKNKVFASQYKDLLDRRVEELAQEKTNNINGVPIRTLIAKDILNTLIEKTYLKTDIIYNDMANTAVRLTDALLKALKKNECNK